MAASRKKKMPLFYAIYLCFLLAAIVALCFAMSYVRTLLKEYEEVQPKYLAQQIFEEKFEQFEYERLLDADTSERFRTEAGYETMPELYNKLRELLEGKEITYSRTSEDFEDGSITYTVIADSRRLADFKLTKKAEKTTHGFDVFEEGPFVLYNLIVSERLDPGTKPDEVYYTYLVTAPADTVVKIEGGKDGEKTETREYMRTDLLSRAKASFEGIPYVEYKIIASAPPTVTGTDRNGNESKAEYTESSRTFAFPFVWYSSVEEEMKDYAIEFAKEFEIYSQHGSSLDSIRKYFDKSTELYQNILSLDADMWMVNKFKSCDFTEVQTGEYFDYGDGSVSLRVSFVWIGHRDGKADSTDILDYTFVFTEKDGKMLVTEAYNN